LNATFYPVDIVIKNPYLDTLLYNEFNILINNQIINFNYDFYLDFNDIIFDDLDLNEEDLYKEYIAYNIIKQFSYNSNISFYLINNLFFNLNKFNVTDLVD
jgi:hypothetical protein